MKLLLDGSAWFVIALVVGAATTVGVRDDPARALSRLYGCVIGVMGTGHVAAVTILHRERWLLYALGGAILISGFALAIAAGRATTRTLQWLNAVPGAMMVAALTSAPLAVPAVLNILYLRKPRRGFVIASVSVYALMLVAAGIMIALGRTAGGPGGP